MTEDLRPCPFCGGPATIAKAARSWKVECEGRFGSCTINARTHYQPTAWHAVEAWNTRAPVKVRALDWKLVPGCSVTFYAETMFGEWSVWEIGDGYVRAPGIAEAGRRVDGDIEAAKAAAQADYELRIREALE